MKNKFVSLLLVIILAFSPMICMTAAAYTVIEAEETVLPVTNDIYSKIHFYFGSSEYATINSEAELGNAVTNLVETVNSLCAVSDGEKLDMVNMTVRFAGDFTATKKYLEFRAERKTLKNADEVRDFRQRLNEYSREYHTELMEEKIKLLADFDSDAISTMSYAPFASVSMSAYDIDVTDTIDLAKNPDVYSISFYSEAKRENDTAASGARSNCDDRSCNQDPSWNQTLSEVNAYDIVTDGTYTGEVVKIGILEYGGVCDLSYPVIADKDITIHGPQGSCPVANHATHVTAAVALIAPDAKLYVKQMTDNLLSDLEWFIASGCDIINCSYNEHFGYEYSYGIDGAFDYIVEAYFVTIVVSSGNNDPGSSIKSPGLAYNAITVGGVYTDGNGRLVHHSEANWYCESPSVKPNISAPYLTHFPDNTYFYGTSLAAPIVTGCIGLLLDMNSYYSVHPERVMSLITSTAQKTYRFALDGYGIGDFDTRVGAGVVDLEAMLECSNNYLDFENYMNSPDTSLATMVIPVSEGDIVKISAAWLAHSTTPASALNVDLTDYYLAIDNPAGLSHCISEFNDTNVETIEVQVWDDGYLYVDVIQNGNRLNDIHYDYGSITYRKNPY